MSNEPLFGCGYCGAHCLRCGSDAAVQELWRPNRHDWQRKVGGRRSPGEEWALMCRRVEAVVVGFDRWLAEPDSKEKSYYPPRTDGRAGGRRTMIMRAICQGGWTVPEDHPLARALQEVLDATSGWLRRKRHARYGRLYY